MFRPLVDSNVLQVQYCSGSVQCPLAGCHIAKCNANFGLLHLQPRTKPHFSWLGDLSPAANLSGVASLRSRAHCKVHCVGPTKRRLCQKREPCSPLTRVD